MSAEIHQQRITGWKCIWYNESAIS